MGNIIGICGPSGAGKGYCKQGVLDVFPGDFREVPVVTTRARRVTDGIDRETDVPLDVFMTQVTEGKVVFAHQPYGSNGHWYGFRLQSIEEALQEGHILTEIHPHNVGLFKQYFPGRVFVVGIVAPIEYLARNLCARGSESEAEKELRLRTAMTECTEINRLSEEGLVDSLLVFTEENRPRIRELVIEEVRKGCNLNGEQFSGGLLTQR